MDLIEPSRPFPIVELSSSEYAWLDAMPLGVVVMNCDGDLLHANAEFSRILGLAATPAAGQSIAAFAPGLLTNRTDSSRRRVERMRRADGAEVSVETMLRSVDFGGRVGLLATITPASQEVSGFGAFREMFDNAPYGLALVAPDGTVSRVNARLCAMFDYAASELEGQPIEALVPHRVRNGHGALRQAYCELPTSRAMGDGHDLTGRKKDGVEFPVEIGLCSVATESGPMICASVIDITGRKRSEHGLRDANEQLEEFTYVAAHDLRAPIRGIGNLIDFLLEDHGETAPDSVVRYIHRMRERVVSMERLIDDLLVYARASKGAAKFESIDLAAMVQDVLSTNAPPPGLRLHIDIGSTSFEGARTPLLTALRNLFSNAIKHHDSAEMEITIKSRDEGDFVVIDVCDDGPGIPEAAQQRVFKLFQTLAASPKREGVVGGSGLGLTVAKRLVNQHGGRLDLSSANGRRGCTFRIWWPRRKRTDYGA